MMATQRAYPTRHHARGATLIELLVVISIIVVVIGASAATITAIASSGREASAVNSVSLAARVARAYAMQEKGFSIGSYSGAAAIFTPSGTVRFVENDEFIEDDSGNLLEALGLNGYADIEDVEELILGQAIGVVGIARGGGETTANLYLFAPPFAIRFDERGMLGTGIDAATSVLYERRDNSGQIPKTTTLVGTVRNQAAQAAATGTVQDASIRYSPEEWDARRSTGVPVKASSGRYQLPFGHLEAVIGVYVFDRNAFYAQGLTLGADTSKPARPVNSAAHDWILKNGRPMFFSRYSGALLRQEASK